MTVPSMLATQIRPRDRYLRAANLEAHQEQAEHYIPTSRALEVLRRLVHSMEDSTVGAEVVDIDRVSRVVVETNELAAPLVRTDVPTRLAAMFSIPFVVAVALNEGAVLPASFDEAHRRDPRILQLMRKVDVRQTAEMTARLPAERAARVSVTLDDGRQVTREVPNPIGDADHHPFGRDEVLHKFGLLIGAPDAAVVADVVDRLPDATDAGSLIPTLERGPQGGAG